MQQSRKITNGVISVKYADMSTQVPLVTKAEVGNTVTDNLIIIHPESEGDLL